jgi:Mn2+/Fe2+ NRAMP family transporter
VFGQLERDRRFTPCDLTNFIGFNPIAALFWTAVINGVLAPLHFVLLMLPAKNQRIMGEHVHVRRHNLLGWLTTLIMAAAPLALTITLDPF